jgi:hypothetical protein
MGYTQNFASPSDRLNFGTNFNWRSYDFRLNQFYLVWENALERDSESNVGYRVDLYGGHNTPFQVANGLFSDFTGFDPNSQSYEIIFATPFTHTGILSTVHATDTLDMTAGVVVGSDVFEDNNGRPSFAGNVVWSSCYKRTNWTTAWITGPEQFNNNDNYRTIFTSYLSRKFGNCNQWTGIVGGHLGYEDDAVTNPFSGELQNAEW